MKHNRYIGPGPLALVPGLVALFLATASDEGLAQDSRPKVFGNKPAQVYYCPNRTPDQRYSDRQLPGCIPLVDKEAEVERKERAASKGEDLEARTPARIENLEREVSSFLRDYRAFLKCCADDPNSLDNVGNLEDRAFDLLKDIQNAGLVNMELSQRGFTLSQIISPVAQARIDLREIRLRLQSLGEAKDKLTELEFEKAGQEQQKIEQEEQALKKKFRPVMPPESARTGTEIQDTTLPNKFGETFSDTTLRPATGTDIGTVVSPSSDQQQDLRPRPGLDTQDTTLPGYRVGPDTQDTTLPYSFGGEVDLRQNPAGSTTTPARVGPNIGDSTLNERR